MHAKVEGRNDGGATFILTLIGLFAVSEVFNEIQTWANSTDQSQVDDPSDDGTGVDHGIVADGDAGQ